MARESLAKRLVSKRTRKDPERQMPLLEHLAELRSRIIKMVLAVMAGAVICWFLYPWIFDVLVGPYCDLQSTPDDECRLLQTEPLEGFSTRLRIAGYGGLALAMPVVLWQLWRFITPGLYSHERRYALPFVFSSMVLFILGAALAFFVLPRALDFLITIGGGDENLITNFRPLPYFELVTYMMLAFGLGFEFPIILIFLQLAGVVQPDTLRKHRRYAIVGIVALAAVVTPTGDPYSLMMLSVPMYIFYEAAIVIAVLLIRRRRAKERTGEQSGAAA